MEVLERMYQLHSGSVSNLIYNLGGNPLPIIDEWQGRVGESAPLAAMFGGEAVVTLDDAANGAYWDTVKLAKDLYFADMARETALAVANSITQCGVLRLADDIEFTNTGFAQAWNDAHPDEPRICRNVDIG